MSKTRNCVVAVVVALAAGAPVAAARPIDPGYTAPERHPVEITPSAPDVRTVVVHDSGFDWLDAAIGAAVAGGLLSLTGAGVFVARRPHDDANAPLGAH